MHSIAAALDALDAAMTTVSELDFAAADPVTRLRALERLETARRRQLVIGHELVAGLAHEDPADVGGPVLKVIADWLRISCAEARRRLRDAEQLVPRTTITGETLPAGTARDGSGLAGRHARPATPEGDPDVRP